MAEGLNWHARRERFLNNWHAKRGARQPGASGFVSQPEPHGLGMVTRGRQLIAGNLMFAGRLVEARGAMIWDLTAPDGPWTEDIHRFAWLDDLAAVGDERARHLAQDWLWEWIRRYGRGKGRVWTPEATGRRIIRWVQHAIFLLRGQDSDASKAYFAALSNQANFLARRWRSIPPGQPRFEALTGLLYAGVALENMTRFAEPAHAALAEECAKRIDETGGIVTRNPEELTEILTLLTWSREVLESTGHKVAPEIEDAIARIAPTLRSLRHMDGALARFQGGGAGAEGRLDMALAASGTKTRRRKGLSMGYARLNAGRSSVIVDAAPPASGPVSGQAHASTLGMELCSARRPLIVSCGPGAPYGTDWRRSCRSTAAHSATSIGDQSSAAVTNPRWVGAVRRELMENPPQKVPAQVDLIADGLRFEGAHDGFVSRNGLTCARSIVLSHDGRSLSGEEFLVALEDRDKQRFDAVMQANRLDGIPYQTRFHLHPEVDVGLDMGGQAVSLSLRSGEVWVFRFSGPAQMTVEPSTYLETGRLKPRASKQIVLSGRAMEYATRVSWTMAKAQDTPTVSRDLVMDELELA